MTNHNAHEAKMARLSYNEYTRKRAEEARLHKKFPVPTICKLALIFCVIVSPSVFIIGVVNLLVYESHS